MATDEETLKSTAHSEDAPASASARRQPDQPPPPTGVAADAARRAADAIGLTPADWLNQLVREESAAQIAPAQDGSAREKATPTASNGPAVDDLPAEVGQTVAEAAAAAGIPVHTWLAQLLKEASMEEAGVVDVRKSGRPAEPGGKATDEASDVMEAAARQAAAAGVPVSTWLSMLIKDASAGGSATADGASALTPTLLQVSTKALAPSQFQMRISFDPEAIASLASSIRSRGVLNPIIVRKRGTTDNEYEIIAGERRWRAAMEAGLADVPVLLLDAPDRDAMEIALVENLQRNDLSALEEAEGYRRLVEELGETQDALARVVGKSRSHISNTLRLLRLPPSVKTMINEGRLSAGHARAVLAAQDPEALAKRAVEHRLTVRETERLAQGLPAGTSTSPRQSPEKDPDLEQIEDELSRLFGVAVTIALRGGDRGALTIRFKGLEKLHEVIARLRM
ncbi:MAG TPA: ParB/RepB/Spo0J family partition protein [Alphaproteobacteria bacterium]|nr:ParB/RepB/Spo0J family partition protein [Alphaproteobacteria bacterium]